MTKGGYWVVSRLVLTHDKGDYGVEKLARINGFEPSQIVSVGDSTQTCQWKIEGFKFIGFNPRERALGGFHGSWRPCGLKRRTEPDMAVNFP